MVFVKICGISDLPSLKCAVENGAKFIGLVFYPPSSRYVETEQAKILARHIPTGVKAIGLFVDPTDEELDRVIPITQLDMIQLHGSETPGRVQDIKDKYSIKIIKALPVSTSEDLLQVEAYEAVADWLLFDTKTPEHGGSGERFDWTLLTGRTFKKPWMLAGGINIDNIAEALSVLNPNAIDVSSGVEIDKGVKDPAKIEEFLKHVRLLDKTDENH